MHVTENDPTTTRLSASSIRDVPISWSPSQPAVLVHPSTVTVRNETGSSRTWIVCARWAGGGRVLTGLGVGLARVGAADCATTVGAGLGDAVPAAPSDPAGLDRVSTQAVSSNAATRAASDRTWLA